MATKPTPLHEFPADMLAELHRTLLWMHPEPVIRSAEDLDNRFESGRKVGAHSVAQNIAIAAEKARQRELGRSTP